MIILKQEYKKILSLILIYIVNIVICDIEIDCIKKAQVKILSYDKSIKNFYNRFYLIDTNGNKISIRVRETLDSEIKVSFKYVSSNRSWIDNVFTSVNSRNVETAFTDSPDYYYSLVNNEQLGDELKRKTMVKINLIPGKEDPYNTYVIKNDNEYEIFSVMYFGKNNTIRYSYLVENKKENYEEQNFRLVSVTSDHQVTTRSLGNIDKYIYLQQLIPHYIVQFGDSLNEFFVIYGDGKYVEHNLDSIVTLQRPTHETKYIFIDKGPKYIKQVKCIIRHQLNSLDDDLYILDENWLMYVVIIDKDNYKLTAYPINIRYKNLVESIKKRNATTTYSNEINSYYSVEIDKLYGKVTDLPKSHSNKYILFYGTEEKSNLFQQNINRLHSVMVQYPSHLQIYSIYSREKNDQIWLYYHKEGESFTNEADSNIIGFYNSTRDSWINNRDKTPNYIIPIAESEYVIVIYPDHTYSITDLHKALTLDTKGRLHEPREILYYHCPSIKTKKIDLKSDFAQYDSIESFEAQSGNNETSNESTTLATTQPTTKSSSNEIFISFISFTLFIIIGQIVRQLNLI